MKVTFALALVGPSDDLLIQVFDSEEALRRFAADHPPAPVEGRDRVTQGPLAEAFVVRDCGPSDPLGYWVTKLEDGVPVDARMICDPEDEPFDPTVPLFAREDSAA